MSYVDSMMKDDLNLLNLNFNIVVVIEDGLKTLTAWRANIYKM